MQNDVSHKKRNIKIIACETVIEEMLSLMPADVSYRTLDFGLHVNPQSLKNALQQAINDASEEADTIVLGYGLCSQALVGIEAHNCTLVVPKVDDCIAIFLGSAQAYLEQHRQCPGTYYLTRGWIKAGDTPFTEVDTLIKQYGQKKAYCLLNQILKNYSRLAFIDTGNGDIEPYRSYTQNTAERFGLKYQELKGSGELIRKMLFGPWDDDFIIVRPGKTVTFLDFKDTRSIETDSAPEEVLHI